MCRGGLLQPRQIREQAGLSQLAGCANRGLRTGAVNGTHLYASIE